MPQLQTANIEGLGAQVASLLSSLDPNTPVVAIGIFQVDRKQDAVFLDDVSALSRTSRSQPGCNAYSLHKNVETSGSSQVEYLIHEDWQSVRALRAQWNSQHLQEFLDSLGVVLVSAPDLRFYFGTNESRKPESPGSSDI